MAVSDREIQYRYYETPPGSYVLALLGERWIRPYGLDLPKNALHFHNLLELGFCHEGQGEMTFLDKKIPYAPGTITVIPANCPHNTRTNEGTTSTWEYFFIEVDGFIERRFSYPMPSSSNLMQRIGFKPTVTNKEENPLFYKIISLMLSLYYERPALYTESINSVLSALIIAIANLSSSEAFAPTEQFTDNGIIQQSLTYIKENYKNQIKIPDIARACHLSETHFRRLFESNLNISPLHYVNLVRIDHACRMLRNTEVPIQIIATECGFVTLSSFNRNFKSQMGVSPKKWREAEVSQTAQIEKSALVYNGWR